MLTIPIGSTFAVWVRGAHNALTAAALASLNGTWELWPAKRVSSGSGYAPDLTGPDPIDSGTLTYSDTTADADATAEQPAGANYAGTVPAATTGGLTDAARYYLRYTLTDGGSPANVGDWWEPAQAAYAG